MMHLRRIRSMLLNTDKNTWLLFLFAFIYATYWHFVTPIQYNGDSDSYLSVGRMLLGHVGPIFRTPGYPILLVLTGAIIPGTFFILLWVQALFAAIIPVFIYQILLPYGKRLAMITAIIVVLSGTTTVHSTQVMTEQFFTFLLFLGLLLVIKIIRTPASSTMAANFAQNSNRASYVSASSSDKLSTLLGKPQSYIKNEQLPQRLFYWFALTFAALNTVRPIAWVFFWGILLLLIYHFWQTDQLRFQWKHILRATLLFMALMSIWTIADEVLFSFGARYSPVISMRSSTDNFFEIYYYDLPFYEAYFSPWKKRVANLTHQSLEKSTTDQRAMQQVHKTVLAYISKNQDALLSIDNYPFTLFGKYAQQPKVLADIMFANPNYAYANYIRFVIEQTLSKQDRLSLYYSVAKEANTNWPQRWFDLLKTNPGFAITGPSHGTGSNRFLLAYTSLRHYIPNPEAAHYHSLLNEKNGPATRFLFETLKQGLYNHPDLWKGVNNLFTPYLNNPEGLRNKIINKPNQQYAWDITRMSWYLMGYHTMSDLLGQVADETIAAHPVSRMLRTWEMILMVAGGPGLIEFDHLGPQLGQVESYDYIETPQLSQRETQELRSTQMRYQQNYTQLQSPILWGYLFFYLCKPLFLLTSIIAISIFWALNRPIIIPLILMVPYLISIFIYGLLFTALPRYTDPTLSLPFIVTIMALPEYLSIWNQRKKDSFEKKDKALL